MNISLPTLLIIKGGLAVTEGHPSLMGDADRIAAVAMLLKYSDEWVLPGGLEYDYDAAFDLVTFYFEEPFDDDQFDTHLVAEVIRNAN